MAAAVICECCGEVKQLKEMRHIRVHGLSSATEYVSKAEDYFDVCTKCYSLMEKLLTNKEKKK